MNTEQNSSEVEELDLTQDNIVINGEVVDPDDPDQNLQGTAEPARLPKTYVLHHDDNDGWFGGAIAIGTLFDPTIEIIAKAVQYGQDFPVAMDDLKNEDSVYIIDFSYSREILDEVHKRVQTLVVLDHHETAESQLKGAPYAIYDLTKSGALLAWEYFVPQYPPSPVCEIVNAWDLWNKNHPDYNWDIVRAFYLGTREFKGNYDFWNAMAASYSFPKECIEAGNALLEQFFVTVNDVKNDTRTVIEEINGKRVCFFRCASDVSLLSDALYSDPELNLDITAAVMLKDDQWVTSLRTPKPHEIHVGNIAKKLGGGGHKAAAGFRVHKKDIDETDAIAYIAGLLKTAV